MSHRLTEHQSSCNMVINSSLDFPSADLFLLRSTRSLMFVEGEKSICLPPSHSSSRNLAFLFPSFSPSLSTLILSVSLSPRRSLWQSARPVTCYFGASIARRRFARGIGTVATSECVSTSRTLSTGVCPLRRRVYLLCMNLSLFRVSRKLGHRHLDISECARARIANE